MKNYDYMAERDDALREHKEIKEQAERLRFRVAELSAALRGLLKLPDQVRSDFASAHEEICKLQGLDPAKHAWPSWTPQANTLRWMAELEASAGCALKGDE